MTMYLSASPSLVVVTKHTGRAWDESGSEKPVRTPGACVPIAAAESNWIVTCGSPDAHPPPTARRENDRD